MKLTAVSLTVLTLIMGCGSDGGPTMSYTPSVPLAAETSPANPSPASKGHDDKERLRAELVKHDNGFSFPLHISEGAGGFGTQTLLVPHEDHLVAHLVKRTAYEPDGKRFQLDVVTIQPEEQDYYIYPVADVIVQDDYSVDSIAGAYGFTDQNQLVLIQPKERDDGQEGVQYDVIALDPYTGRIRTIAADAVPDVSPAFYAKGWMDSSGQLYLNSYSDGRLWSVDTSSGQVRLIEGEFKHSWPLYLLSASPSGNLFWHEQEDNFRLYNRNGEQLKVIPQAPGFHSYPAFEWSPDSRHAALAFTLSDSRDHVLGGEDAYIIAPEVIAFYDQTGTLTWDVQAKPKEGFTNVDWNGWLADGEQGILSWYRLDRSEEGAAPHKVDLSYALADVTTGKLTELTPAKRLEDLEKPVPVARRTAEPLFIDREEELYWSPAEVQANANRSYVLLSQPADSQLIWATYDYNAGQTTITRYDPVNHAASTTVFNELLGEELQLVNDTLVVDNKMNYKWIH
ncbi:hypothetical protein SAMN05216378_3181 [Paenibacillus catalpae]|uniref:Uncharacterized protein n=1 Tax=Paenibacillus catalpae TaxID=1045775 RepID=A0A1I2APZ7_9BACL|nr:hypothetical protein [Paenibacillus catalpae]SFE45648.1 hypothetical protein SAMN05216378_3181 [Paenibacillus catalpae]